MVYTPPFSRSRLDEIASLWNQYHWLPRDIGLNITYPADNSILDPARNIPEDADMLTWGFEQYIREYPNQEKINPLAKCIMNKRFAALIQRQILNTPKKTLEMNGCCIPGVKKAFISPDGAFRVCEQIDYSAPKIGNVQDGFNVDVIRNQYIAGYVSCLQSECKKCWASGICSLCYTSVFKNGVLHQSGLNRHCTVSRNTEERILKFYAHLIESDPCGLDFLYGYEIYSKTNLMEMIIE